MGEQVVYDMTDLIAQQQVSKVLSEAQQNSIDQAYSNRLRKIERDLERT